MNPPQQSTAASSSSRAHANSSVKRPPLQKPRQPSLPSQSARARPGHRRGLASRRAAATSDHPLNISPPLGRGCVELACGRICAAGARVELADLAAHALARVVELALEVRELIRATAHELELAVE